MTILNHDEKVDIVMEKVHRLKEERHPPEMSNGLKTMTTLSYMLTVIDILEYSDPSTKNDYDRLNKVSHEDTIAILRQEIVFRQIQL